MEHLIIDRETLVLPEWEEGLKGVGIVTRDSSLSSYSPDCVLWFRLRSGEFLSQFVDHEAFSGTHRVVILADEPIDSVIFDSLLLGARGCCNSRSAPEVLKQVFLVVDNGGFWVGASLVERLVGTTNKVLSTEKPKHSPVESACLQKLSEREREVAVFVASGLSNKEVARRMGVTERTIKAHLTAIFEKLAVRDRLQLSVKVNAVHVA